MAPRANCRPADAIRVSAFPAIREGSIGIVIVVMVMVVITPMMVMMVVVVIIAPPPIIIVMMVVIPILSQLRLGARLARFIGARRRFHLIGGFEERDRVWYRLQ